MSVDLLPEERARIEAAYGEIRAKEEDVARLAREADRAKKLSRERRTDIEHVERDIAAAQSSQARGRALMGDGPSPSLPDLHAKRTRLEGEVRDLIGVADESRTKMIRLAPDIRTLRTNLAAALRAPARRRLLARLVHDEDFRTLAFSCAVTGPSADATLDRTRLHLTGADIAAVLADPNDAQAWFRDALAELQAPTSEAAE